MATTFVLALDDRATVSDRDDLAEVSFGTPMTWLHQDFTSMDPPFPYVLEPGDPLDFPTTISAGFFAIAGATLVVELGVVTAMFFVVRRYRGSRTAAS